MNKLEHSPAPGARNIVGTDRRTGFFSPSERVFQSFAESLVAGARLSLRGAERSHWGLLRSTAIALAAGVTWDEARASVGWMSRAVASRDARCGVQRHAWSLKILRKKKKKGKRNGKSSGAKRHVYREKLGLSSEHTGKSILRTYFHIQFFSWVVKLWRQDSERKREKEREK